MCVGVVNLFRRGSILRIHLLDDTSVEGVFVRRRGAYLVLSKGKIGAGGVFHELGSERLMVPRVLVMF